MDEHGKVAGGERGLAMGDGAQRQGGMGEQLVAVRPGDLAMLVDPLKRQPLCSHAGSGGADLVLGFKVDALCFQRPVIDASIDVELSQALVDMACPALPPLFQKQGKVPVPARPEERWGGKGGVRT